MRNTEALPCRFTYWSRVASGLFHDFHQSWSIRIKDALDSGRLPEGVAALVERRAGPKESDVPAIEVRPKRHRGEELDASIATLQPPVTRIVRRTTNVIMIWFDRRSDE
jgi:hypothetical protein